MALPAYRGLLRASRLAFQGDERLLAASRASIRAAFLENAALAPTDPAVPAAVQHARDVADILRQNVVQGKKEGDRYRLRIHDETERGDNDTVKNAGGKTAKTDGKTCANR
ncbi:hypothetical protein GGS23DRAFT_598884 [Durotheca rogersii]|uniref:uncharacterized protein n=1 Tax=Durotheca rogersii TaxID=419775 RepID=UPI00221FBB17|nr:uncharacterized protein GGS23DRAFT_598884 [Durotheca rogersii]KAI5861002.1 hypothetical protein GGS23DRAFT_598884 [Durotheca rogersii]